MPNSVLIIHTNKYIYIDICFSDYGICFRAARSNLHSWKSTMFLPPGYNTYKSLSTKQHYFNCLVLYLKFHRPDLYKEIISNEYYLF